MAVKIIYFVHGTTTDNINHKSTGWLHGKLSEKGIEQSIRLREQIDLNEIDLVISSDLKRAIDSAKYTFKDSKVILHDKRIRECNYGDLNGENTTLALEVITKNISWKEAIDNDWRKTKNWQPGWRYEIIRLKIKHTNV